MRRTVSTHTLRLTRQVDSLPEMLYNVYNVPPSTEGIATKALSSIASLPGTRACAHTSSFCAEACMNWTRSSGILLHPTSLPGQFGIGDLGQAAYRWIDFLAASRQALWQVLPLGPTGFADSPYACLSAFAGNPLLIDLDTLVEAGDLAASDLADPPAFPDQEIDYGAVIAFKMPLLHKAAANFCSRAPAHRRAAFAQFCAGEAHWLDSFALFMALKQHFDQAIWYDWDAGAALRAPEALAHRENELAPQIAAHKVLQFFFFEQWQALKTYANRRGIQIIGDVPIFVAADSADVWANPDLFYLDERGRPTVVSGVPPDYFSETGQRWGNPLYRWDEMARRGYAWWVARMQAVLHTVDIVRIDHFRGFVGYWEIPADEPTAIRGRWVPGPGAAVFEAIEARLGRLPILAEDLGVITPEVIALRERFDFPGMKILQFAFDQDALQASFGADSGIDVRQHNPFLPHNYTPNFVVYTGTHDNNTAAGWFDGASAVERQRAVAYLGLAGKAGAHPEAFHWALIRAAMASVAVMAIVPLQDVLGLGSAARMNLPGTVGTNWKWRCTPNTFGPANGELAARLATMVDLYERYR
jgi:4-alpha-glucanotransferase